MKLTRSDINQIMSPLNDQYEISSNSSTRKNIEWSYENEEILAEWCDVAQCYKWLNTETYKYYKNMNSYLTIPCIVFSTISGSASFGIPSVPIEYQYIIPFLIGSITISVGIMTTVQQYYRYSELNETHRILSIAWDKLARNIRIELSKSPLERIDARHFIKFTRLEFDRLMENSEIIPDNIIKNFNLKIKEKSNDLEDLEANHKRNRFSLKKPDICDSITSININRKIWFQQDNKNGEHTIQSNERNRNHSKKKIRHNSYNNDSNDDEIYVSPTPMPSPTSKNNINDEYVPKYHYDLSSLAEPDISYINENSPI